MSTAVVAVGLGPLTAIAAPADRDAAKPALTGTLFLVLLRWLAAVLGCLLGIAGLFPGHISRIVMILAVRIHTGLLLIRAFVVGH